MLVTITTSMAEPSSKHAGSEHNLKLFCQVIIALYSLQLQPPWLNHAANMLVQKHNLKLFCTLALY